MSGKLITKRKDSSLAMTSKTLVSHDIESGPLSMHLVKTVYKRQMLWRLLLIKYHMTPWHSTTMRYTGQEVTSVVGQTENTAHHIKACKSETKSNKNIIWYSWQLFT